MLCPEKKISTTMGHIYIIVFELKFNKMDHLTGIVKIKEKLL